MSIQQAFNIAAVDYDKLRRSLIPCFDDFYSTAVEVISSCQRLQDSCNIPFKALDLGAGTGLYSSMAQAAFPNVEFTLGERELVLKLLNRKMGSLSPELTAKVSNLSLERLEVLAEALLDFNSVEDLSSWLG